MEEEFFKKECLECLGKSLNKSRVLLMDDDEAVRSMAGLMLRNLGCEAILVRDGFEMMRMYRSSAQTGVYFDAVIMDLNIPCGMGGKDAVRELLSFDPAAKAILSTASVDDPVVNEAGKYGFSAVLAKPYTVQELTRTLHRVISGHKR